MGTVDISSLFNIQSVLVRPIITVGLTSLLFGFYALIFGQSIHFLYTRSNMINNKRLHTAWIACLFVMATVISIVAAANDVADSVVYFRALQTKDLDPFITYLLGNSVKRGLSGTLYIGYVLTNCIADSILIHRLYTICGAEMKLLIAFPVVTSIIVNVFGLALGIMQNVQFVVTSPNYLIVVANCRLGYFIANAVTNSMITLILAGRIWWAARDARRGVSCYLQRNSVSPEFRTIVSMILQSGVIYPTVLVVHVVLVFNTSASNLPVNFTPVIILVAGIAPTFVILLSNINRYARESQSEDKSVSLQLESTGVNENKEL